VHVVNSRLDAGKIILQKKVKISKFDTAKSLAKKVLIQEHKLYPKAIRKVLSF
jgi:folate-dependent phosphoribosylglycinamide formyltransferase PurN